MSDNSLVGKNVCDCDWVQPLFNWSSFEFQSQPPHGGQSTKWCGNQLSFSSSHLPALSSQRHLAPRDRGAHAGESVGEKVVKGCGKGKGEEVSPYGDDTTRRNWGRGWEILPTRERT